jgi:hypothetical protein
MALISTARIELAGQGDSRAPSQERRLGLIVAAVGLSLAMITLIANLVAGAALGDGESVANILPWSFGLTTLAFGTVKFGIAVVLVGILVRLYMRIAAVKESLPALMPNVDGDRRTATGDYDSPQGPATATEKTPKMLPIHTMARKMWAPMLAMGAMALLAGTLVSFNWNSTGSIDALAWTQGLQFLGEGFLLSGISFLLGSILAAIRTGGSEAQESFGVTVKTLKMPTQAKAFVGLMMTGLMLAIAQFILYVTFAANGTLDAAALNWLGPLRELSLGLLLSGIILALATIAKALGFQFDRIHQLITTGK